MANQWYYKNDEQRQGPVSDSQLRKLTETGELTKETLIWKEGMTDWKKAVALKGLFPSSDPSVPPPIPIAVNGETPEIPNSESTPKTALSFGESAKLTGNLAAKQTELTKINQVSIPAQHVKIGQHVYDSKHEQSQHAELFAEIDRLNNSIREVEEATKSQPQPNSISERAMSLASQTANAAKLKTYQMQRRLKLIALGKTIFESGKTPEACSQQKTEIDTLLSRAGTLTEEIADIKGKLAEQGRGAAQAGRSLLNKTAIVVASSIFCAPVGLFLIWRHPQWDKQTKLRWAGISLACFFGFMVLGSLSEKSQTVQQARGPSGNATTQQEHNPLDNNGLSTSSTNTDAEKSSRSKETLLEIDDFPLSMGRPDGKEYLAALKNTSWFEVHTPVNGIDLQGSSIEGIANDFGITEQCRVHVGGYEKPSGAKLSIIVFETIEDSKVCAVIVGSPYNHKKTNAPGNRFNELGSALSHDLLPGFDFKKLSEEEVWLIKPATRRVGKATVTLRYTGTEVQGIVKIDKS